MPHKNEMVVSEDRSNEGRANGRHGGASGSTLLTTMSLSNGGKAPGLIETIGVYAGGEVPSLAETLEKERFRCQFHSELSSLHCWILSAHPRLVVLEADLLSRADPQELKNLRETLERWGILSLLLVPSVEKIKQWRRMVWPSLHFYCGPVDERALKDKIMRLMAERLLLERPVVAVLSERPYLLSHLEMVLRHYGIRMIPARTGDTDEAQKILAPEHVDAVLMDAETFDEKGAEKMPAPAFLVSDGTVSLPGTASANKEAYAPDRFNELCLKILEDVRKKREMALTAFRDRRTGLYLPETFLHLSEREMALAGRQGEEFSVVRIQVTDARGIEQKFGPIFAGELEMVLGLFIEDRVRSSDFVAKGFQPGQIFILFPGLNRQTASLVGERIRTGFAKSASFGDGSREGFKPRLEYEIYCYPHDVCQIGELEKALKADLAESNPAHLPLRANLAEEL